MLRKQMRLPFSSKPFSGPYCSFFKANTSYRILLGLGGRTRAKVKHWVNSDLTNSWSWRASTWRITPKTEYPAPGLFVLLSMDHLVGLGRHDKWKFKNIANLSNLSWRRDLPRSVAVIVRTTINKRLFPTSVCCFRVLLNNSRVTGVVPKNACCAHARSFFYLQDVSQTLMRLQIPAWQCPI